MRADNPEDEIERNPMPVLPEGFVYCPQCGGWGGEDASKFGDHGWHPCYACGMTGIMTEEAAAARQTPPEDEPERLPWTDEASYAAYQGDDPDNP